VAIVIYAPIALLTAARAGWPTAGFGVFEKEFEGLDARGLRQPQMYAKRNSSVTRSLCR
jgi:hypothetical protein